MFGLPQGDIFSAAVLQLSHEVYMSSDLIVIAGLLASMTALVVFTVKLKLHPFLSLIFASVIFAVISGMKLQDMLTSFTGGMGDAMSEIGIVIALGTIIGVLFEKSGSAETVAKTIFRVFGKSRAALGLAITGYFVSMPVFCDTAFVILSPIAKRLSKNSRVSMTAMALSLFAGLHATHILVPPTPGPLSVTGILNADIAGVMLLGAAVAVPVTLVGYAAANIAGKKFNYLPKDIEETDDDKHFPSPAAAFLTILTPITLMLLRMFGYVFSVPDRLQSVLNILGEPVAALSISVIIAAAVYAHTYPEDSDAWGFDGIIADSIRTAGQITLIVCAGGAFSSVLAASRLHTTLISLFSPSAALGILGPFFIGLIFRSCIGSGTVAMVTAATMISPFLEVLGLGSPAGHIIAVLSCAAGSLAVLHGNDDFFWVIAATSEMETSTAYKTLPVISVLQSFTALICVYILSIIML